MDDVVTTLFLSSEMIPQFVFTLDNLNYSLLTHKELPLRT